MIPAETPGYFSAVSHPLQNFSIQNLSHPEIQRISVEQPAYQACRKESSIRDG
jgi:hypothetical protein